MMKIEHGFKQEHKADLGAVRRFLAPRHTPMICAILFFKKCALLFRCSETTSCPNRPCWSFVIGINGKVGRFGVMVNSW